MNNIINVSKLAFKAMATNKLRTALTILGIVIGAASVIVVYSAGAGIRNLLLKQLESFGTDIIQTEIKIPSNKTGTVSEQNNHSAVASGIQVTTLTLKDAEDLKKISNISGGYATIATQDKVSWGGEARKIFLMGVSADYINIDKTEIATGRFFSEEEDKNLAQVAILGAKIKEELFGDSDAIGKFITIHKSKYQVIGVMEERGK